MTHHELVQLAERWLRGTRQCAVVATERSCWKALESPDAIGWRANGEIARLVQTMALPEVA